MLTELHLSNFKSWRELDMKLGRVTGLFGTNSSGKSSILQFLLMLKQTAESSDRGLVLELNGNLVNLGSFKDLIFNHQENLPLRWNVVWHKEDVWSAEVLYENKQMRKSHEYFSELYILYNVTLACQPFEHIYYLAPLREYPKREYQWSGATPSHVGYRGENTINAILAATIRNETRKKPNSNEEEKPFQEVIAYWLKELGLIHEFSVKEIAEGTGLFRVIVKKSPESPETFLTDVGFGVSQVLPALVLLYYVPEGSIILMEQPEIHLHPSVQSGLADVILQVSKQRNLQVIVESHSEHLLQRFQRRVAEESYSVDELKLYFCDIQQGESKLIDLEMDEFGDIRNYPNNFFGDEMAEIAADSQSGIKTQNASATQMTTKLVIDTNVAIVATGRDTHASESCQDTCKELLGQCKELDIVIDELGLILDEYANKLNPSGKPTIGDAFFKYLKNYQYSSDKIHRVKITPINDDVRGFAELPENCVDRSDRKLLATALVAKAMLVNATDSDWTEQKTLLESLKIEIKQLCHEHSCK